jgi:hypothetical protein
LNSCSYRIRRTNPRPKENHRIQQRQDALARITGDFFTLCVGQPVVPRKIVGERSVPQGSKAEKIEIYIPFLEIKQKGDVFGPTMPVPFSIIQDRAASIITSWFLAEEKTARP